MYLIHADDRGGRASPARVLYWFRSPPGVKVGREPFDESVRRALEATYPAIAFDWKRIASTPMPPPQEAETWRERRQAERAARRAGGAEVIAPKSVPEEDELEGSNPTESSGAAAENMSPSRAEGGLVGSNAAPSAPRAETPSRAGRRRRRRGNRRRQAEGNAAPSSGAAAPGVAPAAPTSGDREGEPLLETSDLRGKEE